MSNKRTTDEIVQFPISAAEERQSRYDAELNEAVDYPDFSADEASEPNLNPVEQMEMGIKFHYRRISGRRRGLCSDRDPFGDDFLGTDDILLTRIASLRVSGNVELYISSYRGSGFLPDSKIALCFSQIKTAADLRHIQQQLESSSKSATWRQHLHNLKETNHEDDLRLLEEEKAKEAEFGVDNLVADSWRIKTLSAIRREFKYLGALEYKDGSLITILDYRPETPFMDLVKKEMAQYSPKSCQHY